MTQEDKHKDNPPKSGSASGGYQRLREFLKEFDEAKGHFEASQRELLMGFRAIFEVLIRFAEESEEETVRLNVLILIRSALDYLIAKTPPAEPAQADQVLIEAYGAILEVLNDEEDRIRTKEEPMRGDDEKLDAIDAIRRVLVIEQDKALERTEDPDAHARIRKVTIE